MDAEQRRAAENEALFREINERIERLSEASSGGSVAEFMCECSRADCTRPVRVSLARYAEVRASPGRFIVVAGHERPDIERVVAEGDGYRVVEKTEL
ncbi:MAG TPA: hypothetical protein VM290_10530 [Gaiellaceae bacterium]|nr:hypothetical protein [Gaiellaceae bacterium]